jgi:hypothetical protein
VKKPKPVNKAKKKPHAAKKAKPTAKANPKPGAKVPAKPKAASRKTAPAKKAAVKSVPRPVPKAVAKAATKAATKTTAKVPAKATAKAPAKAAVKVAAAPVAKVAKAEKAAPEVKPAKVKGESKSKDAARVPAPVDAFPALDPNVKRPAKPFFLEVKPGVERVIKRGDKSAVSQVIDLQARRKGPAAEETSDELAERIERELQSQSFLKRAPMRPQMCTKCGINAVTPRFTIDRELGYCESCAEILHLGETKEARRMEFNLAVKKEEIAPPGPDEIPPEDADEEPVPEDIDV